MMVTLVSEGFGDRIKKLRDALVMTQVEFADHVGVSQKSISNWENDTGSPLPRHIRAITAATACDVNWLRFGHPEEGSDA